MTQGLLGRIRWRNGIIPRLNYVSSSVRWYASQGGAKKSTKEVKRQTIRNKRQEQDRKAETLRAQARQKVSGPGVMTIHNAMRYLRAFEVGQTPESSTITLRLTLVIDRTASTGLRGSVRFPNTVRLDRDKIGVFTTNEELAEKARKAGADFVGGQELIDLIKKGNVPFEKAFATPDAVDLVKSVQRILGPKGCYPNARRGTVLSDVESAITDAIGRYEFRAKQPSLSAPIARPSFTNDQVESNINAFLDAVKQSIKKQHAKHPTMILCTFLSSTHGPSIPLTVK